MNVLNESETSEIIVAIRIKPLEINENEISIESKNNNSLKLLNENKVYKYDYVHWSTGTRNDYPYYISQEKVYESIGEPIVNNSLIGYNCTLFAYGQTGSGKTYTMMGEKNDEGIIPRICKALMMPSTNNKQELINEDDGTIRTFKITYIEIFLEKVRDLLRPNHTTTNTNSNNNNNSNINGNTNSTKAPSLKVREHPTDGPFVEGALAPEIFSYEECMKLMELGSRNRVVASTKMNEQSSRSHAIFTITTTLTKKLHSDTQINSNVESKKNKELDENEVYTIVSKINLVDLAGSENAVQAGSTGERLKEGAAINKSLLTLGRVIKTLAENSMKRHIRRTTIGATPTTERQLDNNGDIVVSNGNNNNNNNGNNNTITPRRGSLGVNTSIKNNNYLDNSNKTPVIKRGTSHNEGNPNETPNIKKSSMIPYRDSVLTYLLKDSLGGNSKTTMIATIRPGIRYADETANTLRYAAQAKKIVNVVTVNENPYVKMIKKLQQEVEELTRKLQTMKPKSPNKISQIDDKFEILSNETEIIETKNNDKKDNLQSDTNQLELLGPPLLMRQLTSPEDNNNDDYNNSNNVINENNFNIQEESGRPLLMRQLTSPEDYYYDDTNNNNQEDNNNEEKLEIPGIPLLMRQLTSPEDHDDIELENNYENENENSNVNIKNDENENQNGNDENDKKSDHDVDIFDVSTSPTIIDVNSDDDNDEIEINELLEETSKVEKEKISLENPSSPTRNRPPSLERMPHLLNSLQKKLSMVRQTSIEVVETYERLSSPTKKSQAKYSQAYQRLLQDLSPVENTDLNRVNYGDPGNENHFEENETNGTDIVTTPYRPVRLLDDLIKEDNNNVSKNNGAQYIPQNQIPLLYSVSNTSTISQLEVQNSPVVILFEQNNSHSSSFNNLKNNNNNDNNNNNNDHNNNDNNININNSKGFTKENSISTSISPPDTPISQQTTEDSPIPLSNNNNNNNNSTTNIINSQDSLVSQGNARTSHSSLTSYESDVSQAPLKEGFLMKRGFVNKAFQRRWCILKGRNIYFYRQYRDKEIRGKINCFGATVMKAEHKKNELPFAFYIYTPNDREHKKWLLQAASDEEMNSWISAIEHVSQQNREFSIDRKDTIEENSNCIIT